MRDIVSPLAGFSSPFGRGADPYAILGYKPPLVLDYENSTFRVSGSTSTAPSVVTATRTGLATQLDASGNLVWNAHNLIPYSTVTSAQWGVTGATNVTITDGATTLLGETAARITADAGSSIEVRAAEQFSVAASVASYTCSVLIKDDTAGYAFVAIDGATPGLDAAYVINLSDGTVEQTISAGDSSPTIEDMGGGIYWVSITDTTNGSAGSPSMRVAPHDGSASEVWSPVGTEAIFATAAHLYRSDLGGMAPVPLTRRVAGSTTYVPTTSAVVYLPREEAYTYVSGSLVGPYYQKESDARTNLLHTTNALVTQTLTVTAVPHTLHFTGTGTVTLFGVSTAGPLVGTGAGENNRVSLTFTPTAGILTLTVSGTVSDAQLEVGSTPSSYIPNLAASGTVTRSADSTTISAENMPYPTPQVIGPELVTNGTFDTDSDWTKGTGITITGGEAVFTAVATGQNLRQPITLPAGVYLISYDVTEYTTGGVAVFGPAYSPDIQRTAVGSYSEVAYFPGSGNLDIRARGITALKVDNVSVREINPLALSFQMEGLVTGESSTFADWTLDANNGIQITSGASDFTFTQEAAGVVDSVTGGSYTSGINVPFNIASRHGSTFINGAVNGTALTADTTPTALPDLSATTFDLAPTFNGFIKEFRVWADDIGDSGIAEAST